MSSDKFTWRGPVQDILAHDGEASGVPSPFQFGSSYIGEGRQWLPTPNLQTTLALRVISVVDFVLNWA